MGGRRATVGWHQWAPLAVFLVALGVAHGAMAQDYKPEVPFTALMCPTTGYLAGNFGTCMGTCCQQDSGGQCATNAGEIQCEKNCGASTSEEFYWTLGRYTGTHPGDVVVLPVQTTSPLYEIITPLGMKYSHAAMLTSTTGNTFTDSAWNGVSPRSTKSVLGDFGEHACTDTLYVRDVTGLSPGVRVAVTQDDDVEDGAFISTGLGNGACKPVADYYHIHTWLFPKAPNYYPSGTQGTAEGAAITSGSCEKLLVDECAVPVTLNDRSPTESGVGYTPAQMNTAVTNFYNLAYAQCTGTQSVSWMGWIVCDGLSTQTACTEASYQMVNEALLSYQTTIAEQGGCNEQAGCNPNSSSQNSGQCSSWQEDNGCSYNTRGQMLGAGSLNNQANYLGESPNNSSWSNDGFNFYPNMPDAIVNAAARVGKTAKAATITEGFWTANIPGFAPCSIQPTGTQLYQ
jgi:hypothetical protein